MNSLLKYLSVGPLILLALNRNRLIPAPHVIHKLFVLGLLGIQFGEGIALVVWCDVEGGLFFLAADDEGTADDAVVGFAVDRGAAEDVFAGGFEAGEESTYGAGRLVWN